MKTVKYLLAVVASVFFFIACQKELSTESGLTGGLATGTLRDSLGQCQPVSVNGTYLADSTLRDSNFVYVQILVASPGVYRISTDQQNGFSFRDSGYFANAGVQIVKLVGIGKPTLPIATLFTVTFGTSICSFTVPVSGTAGGGGGGGTAAFTFDNSTGTCANPNIQGTYTVGTPLTNANTVTLTINVTTPGTYTITTTPNNGMQFSGSGTLTTAGPATIQLTGTGTPVAGGGSAFVVNNSTSGCAFSIPVTSSGPSATYTLAGSPGSCTGGTSQGTYTAGTALTAANTITVSVNVSALGAYNISSAPNNGMTFSRAGTFTTTGVQNVILNGSGTPTSAGQTTIGILGSSSGCVMQLTVGQGTSGGGATSADSAWSFNQGTRFFHGPVDTAYIESVPGFGTFLSIEGHTFVTGDTSVYIDIFLPGGVVVPGSYSTTNGAGFNFSTASADIYDANPTTPTAVMTIIITSYNATTKLVQGTYSGNALNAAGTPVAITNGKFRATVRP